MKSTIVRKLSDGEELVVVGNLSVSTSSHTNPREASIERRREAMSESPRQGSTRANIRTRLRG